MKKVYYLSSCSTCIRILKGLRLPADMALIDIKNKPIDEEALELLYQFTGSYEAIFSKSAQKFKDPAIKASIKSDQDYKTLILSEYTFLKRPVFIYDDFISIGNNAQVIQGLQAKFI